jgi:hypothetical protein
LGGLQNLFFLEKLVTDSGNCLPKLSFQSQFSVIGFSDESRIGFHDGAAFLAGSEFFGIIEVLKMA